MTYLDDYPQQSVGPWAVQPGRSICYDRQHAFTIAANTPGGGMSPAGLDGMTHRIAALLNAAATDPTEVQRTHVYGPDHPAQRQVIPDTEYCEHGGNPECWQCWTANNAASSHG